MSVARPTQNLPPELQRIGTTTATLTIPARTGHKRVLKDYFVKAGASSFSDIKLGNVTVARIFDNLAQAILIAGLDQRSDDRGFLRVLTALFPDIPYFYAAQDEAITIVRNAAPTRSDAYFEDVTSGDVGDFTQPGGSKGRNQLWIQNMSNTLASTVTGSLAIDRKDMPDGLTLFTDGTRISANTRFTLYALAANVPVNVGSKTTRIHIFDEFTELFTSENSEGLFVDVSVSNELGFTLRPLTLFQLPKPYVLEPNKVITVKADVIDDGANHLAAGSQQVFWLGRRELLAPGGA